ncbi:flavin reductase family protein [Saccharothrix xinjiangensis]|uniref:Flavin reductase family protein n=1 Tax=Saccharothrix xinjiangensis TaxID=204798 RepID=A0ABV9Y4V5_9PSEU
MTGPDVELREMMSRFPSGVAVITAFDPDGTPRGMTCSSLCSATLDPPTLLVCLRTGSPTAAAVSGSGMFAVNLLHSRGRAAAELFASGFPQRFSRVPWDRPASEAGPHLVDHAHTVADCAVSRTIPTGGHLIVLGRPLAIVRRSTAPPLLYGLRDYHPWPQLASGSGAGRGAE